MSKSHIFCRFSSFIFDVSALFWRFSTFCYCVPWGIKGGIIENWEVKIEDWEVKIGKWKLGIEVRRKPIMKCFVVIQNFVGNCCRETTRIMLWRIWQIKWRTKSEEWIIHMHCGDTKFSCCYRIVKKQQGYCSVGYDKLSEERRVKSE